MAHSSSSGARNAEDGPLHGVVARASAAIDTSSLSQSVHAMHGRALRPSRHLEVSENGRIAPVSVDRAGGAGSGLLRRARSLGLPVGPNLKGRPSHDCSYRTDSKWDSPVHDPSSRGGP